MSLGIRNFYQITKDLTTIKEEIVRDLEDSEGSEFQVILEPTPKSGRGK